MAAIEFIRELSGWKGSACLVKRGADYFAVSSVDAMITGWETLVFPCGPDGEPTSWLEVAGGRGVSRDEAIRELAEAEPDEAR